MIDTTVKFQMLVPACAENPVYTTLHYANAANTQPLIVPNVIGNVAAGCAQPITGVFYKLVTP